MLLQADGAGIDEAGSAAGVITAPVPAAEAPAVVGAPAPEAVAAMLGEDGSFLRGLALAVAVAVPVWALLGLGIYFLF
ncbi:MAG TPA: hypothetical protein VE690_20490 [Rhodopila sp.]|jgi:hypothetical protein|nr:hypothetical protein [Rhodopila sp.]